MRTTILVICGALAISGCVSGGTQGPKDVSDLTSKDTLQLCKIAFTEGEEAYRLAATRLAIKRGASAEKCQKMVASDQNLAVGLAVAGAAVAAGSVAQDGYSSGYGAAWDQFPNGEWHCRDTYNGQFVPNERCAGSAMYDHWP